MLHLSLEMGGDLCGGTLMLLELICQVCIRRHGSLEMLMESIFLCGEAPQFTTVGGGLGSSRIVGSGRLGYLVGKGTVFLSES